MATCMRKRSLIAMNPQIIISQLWSSRLSDNPDHTAALMYLVYWYITPTLSLPLSLCQSESLAPPSLPLFSKFTI